MPTRIRRRKERSWAIPVKSFGRGPFSPRRRHQPLEVGPHYGAVADTTGDEMGHADTTILNVHRPWIRPESGRTQRRGLPMAPMPTFNRFAGALRSAALIAVAALGLAAASLPAMAAKSAEFNDQQKKLLGELNDYFNGIRSMKGDFSQIGPRGVQVKGRFYMTRPGRIRFSYASPARLDIIADGTSVAVRDRKLATQDIWPLNKTPLRFLVADKIDLLKDANVKDILILDEFVTVVIEEDGMFGEGKLTLTFDSKRRELVRWIVTDAQGHNTEVTIFNAEVGVNNSPKLFKIDYTRVLDSGKKVNRGGRD